MDSALQLGFQLLASMQASVSPKITPEVLEQNPQLSAYLALVFGVVLLAGLGSLASWGFVFYRRSRSQSVLAMTEPWVPRSWAFIDLIVVAMTVVALQVIVAGTANKFLKLERVEGVLSLELAAVSGLASILAVLFGVAWICLRYRTGPAHVGFDELRLKTIGIGIVGGLLGLPLLYLLMAVVSSISATKYNHPLINAASDSGQLQTYLFGFFAAAIAAPIVEEFCFRVILQGWLQSIPFKSLFANFVGEPSPTVSDNLLTSDAVTVSRSTTDLTTNSSPLAGDYMLSASEGVSPVETATSRHSIVKPPIWPSIVAGLLFGLAHIEYGASFIPLSLLGIYLGLIYRQTHSVWPCIIIHMMLNSFSMMMLGLLIMLKQAGVAIE